jgi:pyrroloquinoline quinone (PQQ) biosynthesis protein C
MPSAIEPAPLDRKTFRQKLTEVVNTWHCEDTRFYNLLMTGRCPRPVLLRYALSTWASSTLFMSTLAQMANLAPDAQSRLHLIENLMEEHGIFISESTGLVHRPEIEHPALAMRFVRACGGDEAMTKGIIPHAIGPARQMLAEGRWLEAVANLLIGQEYKFSHASALLCDALQRNGLSAADTVFFAVHGEADYQHGEHAFGFVLDHALTRAKQEAAMQAAAQGAQHWFEMHGGAYRRDMAGGSDRTRMSAAT